MNEIEQAAAAVDGRTITPTVTPPPQISPQLPVVPKLAAKLPPAPDVSPRGLVQALSIDERSDGTYDSIITFGGRHWYINELDSDQSKAYGEREKAIAREMQALSQESLGVEMDNLDADYERGNACVALNTAHFDTTIAACVRDHTGPAFNSAALGRLNQSVKAKLTQMVKQKSSLGVSEADFFARR